ncbi:RNA polymerase sigma-70 factor, ECF subfamily [Lachnospiraceae bacterium C10]|jgi:RNA polymerase sigma-70 factor (ECF subfamily)|nr:sigma-70 family RNA polymerase sigma factor [Lachnospiraceae bacterium]SCW42375.1 RNA polymerase sigma-70 factor, ECF subfamily [Lachnospiraceae bacterium C10]SDW94331.1 RNA polymerase sigma-70 factor, ECF subfamily [Lachnospiraceae bacterium KHCPX20]
MDEIRENAQRILEEYGDMLFRYAYVYLKEREGAEDIVQEVLVRYLKKAPVFESLEHEKAWLLRVTSNLCKNQIAYNRLRTGEELREELIARECEDYSVVWDAVSDLPDKYRRVIHLYYQEGYSSREIAEILGQRESTVRSLLRRGRQKLKAVLKEVYDFA